MEMVGKLSFSGKWSTEYPRAVQQNLSLNCSMLRYPSCFQKTVETVLDRWSRALDIALTVNVLVKHPRSGYITCRIYNYNYNWSTFGGNVSGRNVWEKMSGYHFRIMLHIRQRCATFFWAKGGTIIFKSTQRPKTKLWSELSKVKYQNPKTKFISLSFLLLVVWYCSHPSCFWLQYVTN